MQGEQQCCIVGRVGQGLGKEEPPYTSTAMYIPIYLYTSAVHIEPFLTKNPKEVLGHFQVA